MFHCTYNNYSSYTSKSKLYTCHVTSASITKKLTKITSITGHHQANKNDADVNVVRIKKSVIKFFPRGLSDFFPNILVVDIHECGLKTISREDLKGLQSIRALILEHNELISLPDDLLTDMKKLKVISFYNNKIQFLSSKLLQPVINNGLVNVNFRMNPVMNNFFQPDQRDVHGGDSLNELIKIMDAKDVPEEQHESVVTNEAQEPIAVEHVEPFEAAEAMDTTLEVRDYHEDIKEKFLSGIKQMWYSGSFSDLTIVSGTKEFKVHKNILALHSPIIANILMVNPETSEFKINGFTEEAVEQFLKSLYTGDVIDEQTHATELFALAAKYGIEKLKLNCEEIISKSINQSNAYQVFQLAHQYSSQKLKKIAFVELKKFLPYGEVEDEMMEDVEGVKAFYEGVQKLLNSARARKRKMAE